MALPTTHQLKAAVTAARLFVGEANARERRDGYLHLPTGGMFATSELVAAEEIIRSADLIGDRALLSSIVALPEDEAVAVLLARLLELRSPSWLTAISGVELDWSRVPASDRSVLAATFTDDAVMEGVLREAASLVDRAELERVGAIGEVAVMDLARALLRDAGHPALAERVTRVSLVSDRLGYDVAMPNVDGAVQRLEVKRSALRSRIECSSAGMRAMSVRAIHAGRSWCVDWCLGSRRSSSDGVGTMPSADFCQRTCSPTDVGSRRGCGSRLTHFGRRCRSRTRRDCASRSTRLLPTRLA